MTTLSRRFLLAIALITAGLPRLARADATADSQMSVTFPGINPASGTG